MMTTLGESNSFRCFHHCFPLPVVNGLLIQTRLGLLLLSVTAFLVMTFFLSFFQPTASKASCRYNNFNTSD